MNDTTGTTTEKQREFEVFADANLGASWGVRTKAIDIYLVYLKWHEEKHAIGYPQSQAALGRFLASRFTRGRSATGILYEGVWILGPAELRQNASAVPA